MDRDNWTYDDYEGDDSERIGTNLSGDYGDYSEEFEKYNKSLEDSMRRINEFESQQNQEKSEKLQSMSDSLKETGKTCEETVKKIEEVLEDESEKLSDVEKEYKKIMGEVEKEIRETYREIERASKSNSSDLDNLKNKLGGLFNLTAELQKLKSREEETKGTLRSVKNVYERAGYMSEVGGGLGQAVHHFDGYNWDVKNRINPDNLVLLNEKIHDEFHSLYGAGNNTIEQFLEFLYAYHPEEAQGFEENFMKQYGAPRNVNDKLIEASTDWSDTIMDKQFQRYTNFPYLENLNDLFIEPSVDKIPYSRFFLKQMEIPLDKSYKVDGKSFDRAQLSITDPAILDLYDKVTDANFESYQGKSDDELRNILISRRLVELQQGFTGASYALDYARNGDFDREGLLSQLEQSHSLGRERLSDIVNGVVDVPFLNGENPSIFDEVGLGKGIIPVFDKLKEFFDEYGAYLQMDNPFEKWDGKNLEEVLNGDLRNVLTMLSRRLPVSSEEGLYSPDGTYKKRISRFKSEAFKDEGGYVDKEHKDFYNAFRNLEYLVAILRRGTDNETIGRFFKIDGGVRPPYTDEEEEGFHIRKHPNNMNEDDKRALNMQTKKGRVRGKIGENASGIALAGDLYDYVEDDDSIKNLDPTQTVHLGFGKETLEERNRKALDELFKGATNPNKEDNTKDTIKLTDSNCCKLLRSTVESINKKLDTLGQTIAKALEGHVYVFGNGNPSIYDENGMLNFDRGSSSPNVKVSSDKFYSGYKKRVNELEELLESTEDEDIKGVVKSALSVARRMDKNGLYKSEWNQDLVYGFFGEYPKREDFSIAKLEKFRGEYEGIKDKLANITTQEEYDEKIKRIEINIEGLDENKDASRISDLRKERKEWESKEIIGKDIGEDKVQFYKLMEEAYYKVLNQASPTEMYGKNIGDYLKAIEGVNGYDEYGAKARFLETRGRLNKLGMDTSEDEEEAVAKIDRMVSSYKAKLKEATFETEKDDIQQTIDKLMELRSLLDSNEVWWAPLPSNDVPNVINDMPMKGSNAFSSAIYSATALLDASDSEIGRVFGRRGTYEVNGEGKEWHKDSLHSQKVDLENTIDAIRTTLDSVNLSPLRREALEGALPKYEQEYQELLEGTSGGETKQFTRTELAYKRFDYLRERYESTKGTIERFRSNLDLLKDKGGAEQFDALIERLQYFKSELDSLANKDLRRTKLKEQVKELTDDFYELSKTSERILGDDLLRRAEEASLQSINERNRLGINALFGDVNAQNELFGEPPVSKPEKEPLRGRLTTMAYNFRQATQSATQLTGVVNKLFAVVGTGNAVNDMISASSIRQTNEIMLASRRGMEEAEKLYNRIQMLVVELPGNDTFLTNILTMLGTMDKSLNAEDLEYMGGVIADYYMGAQAKGQFNNETERELRNYLMTGQTRNLTNSIIASEIESLKGLNTVKERTIALEKALQTTGMDSIAHYDSYTNTLEEFKGRFQKSFADLGDTYLGLLKMGMDLFNMLDRLTNSGLSQATIFGAVTVFGVLSATVVFAELLSISASLIEAFDLMNDFVKDTTKSYSGLAEAYRQIIRWIAIKIGLVDADTVATSANTVATDADTVATDANTVSIWGNITSRISSIWATIRQNAIWVQRIALIIWEGDAIQLSTLFEEENITYKILSRIVTFRQSIARANHTLSIWIENGTLWVNTKETILNTIEKIKNSSTSVKDTIIRWAHVGAVLAEAGAFAILNGILALTDILLSPIGLLILGIVSTIILLVTWVEKLGEMFGWWTDFGSMIEAISAGLGRIWDAFVNSDQVQYAMYIIGGFFENLQALFGSVSALGGIWEMIFGTTEGRGEWDILGTIINFLGAIGNALWILSPLDEILEIIRAIGAYIGWTLRQWNAFVNTSEFQELIDGFREIRVAIGKVWEEIVPVFDELGKAWAELWGDEKGAEKLKKDGNELLELFKAIAHFIRDYVVPFIKMLVPLIKATLMPLVSVVKFITWIIEGIKWISDHFGMQNDKAPTNIANKDGGYNDILEKQYQYDYTKGKDLAKRYINNNNGNSTIINNNFGEGSVQTNAHNMTQKEVRHLFTSAFGYNKANGVKGVLR